MGAGRESTRNFAIAHRAANCKHARMQMPGSYRRKHDRATPRSWLSLFLRLGGWFSLIAAIGLLLATFFSALAVHLADRFDASGGYAMATITGKSVIGDRDVPDSYHVSFKYKTEAGGQTAEIEVEKPFFFTVKVGSEHPVRYALETPTDLELEPRQTTNAGRGLRVVALILGIVGLWSLWRFGKQTNAAILARRDGEKRFARVIEVSDTGVRVNGRAKGRLIWREEDGQTGESLIRNLTDLADTYKAGDRIVVFRRDDDVVWEGDVGPPRREFDEKS